MCNFSLQPGLTNSINLHLTFDQRCLGPTKVNAKNATISMSLKYCHIVCTVCDNTYVKCLIPGCNRIYQNNQESTVFKFRSVKAYMNDHMKRFHSVTLGHQEDYSKPVVIEAKKNQTPTVSPYLLDGVQLEQAEIGCFEFECTEAATDMEGIVPLEPGKEVSSESKSVEGASGMEGVESNGGNDGNDPDDSVNNDETSVQSSVDSAVQDHSIVPDCS